MIIQLDSHKFAFNPVVNQSFSAPTIGQTASLKPRNTCVRQLQSTIEDWMQNWPSTQAKAWALIFTSSSRFYWVLSSLHE